MFENVRPRRQPVIGLTAKELTEDADKKFGNRRQVKRNRERLASLTQIFGSLMCTYCRKPRDESVLIPVILAHRPGFACVGCFKKFLL